MKQEYNQTLIFYIFRIKMDQFQKCYTDIFRGIIIGLHSIIQGHGKIAPSAAHILKLAHVLFLGQTNHCIQADPPGINWRMDNKLKYTKNNINNSRN